MIGTVIQLLAVLIGILTFVDLLRNLVSLVVPRMKTNSFLTEFVMFFVAAAIYIAGSVLGGKFMVLLSMLG